MEIDINGTASGSDERSDNSSNRDPTSGLEVSLVICTRNRVAALERSIASIEKAVAYAPDIAVEAIIVDNGSTDDTARIAAAWCERQAFPATLATETRPGLAVARNTGLRLARGRIVAMTDDDCALAEDYFQALVRSFERHGGDCIIGGRITLGDPEDLPITIKVRTDGGTLGRGRFPGGFIIGANLAYTNSVARKVGWFDERFGAGTPLHAAEETDWMLRATAMGIPVHYDPSVEVAHFHGRRDVEGAIRLFAGYDFGNGAMFAKHLFRDRRIARVILGDVYRAVRDIVKPTPLAIGVIKRRHIFKLFNEARGFWSFLTTHRK